MEAAIYNQKGEKSGSIELPGDIFEVKMNSDLVYQVAVTQMANRRQVTAHTKDRGEISGGGRKPWRQKGTGRSRHGSTRSPIWRHGGVAFGPRKDKVYGGKVNKKMRRKALAMVLSAKAANNDLMLLDALKIDEPKTKKMAAVLQAAGKTNNNFAKAKILIALPEFERNSVLSGRNIIDVKTVEAAKLNVLDLLNAKCLLMPVDSVHIIEKILIGADTEGEISKDSVKIKKTRAISKE